MKMKIQYIRTWETAKQQESKFIALNVYIREKGGLK